MKNNIKILVADDNKHFLNAFQYILMDSFQENIEKIHLTKSGDECLSVLSKDNVDVCFLDVEMPEMNGVELTKKIIESHRGVVVVALSFHKEIVIVKKMIDAGARFFLTKEDINQNQLELIFEKYLN